jgi:hypothetical protein
MVTDPLLRKHRKCVNIGITLRYSRFNYCQRIYANLKETVRNRLRHRLDQLVTIGEDAKIRGVSIDQ